MAAVHRRIGTPLLTGLSLTSDELGIEPGEVVPRRLPDLFAGSPLLILGRYRGRPAGTVTIHATDAAGRDWSEPIPAQVRDNPAIAAAWARGQIRQLEDRYAAKDGDRTVLERTIVAISLKFQVLCRFTAYVAVDRSQVANKDGSLHRITQPVEQPEGWQDFTGTAAGVVMMDCFRVEPSASRSMPATSLRMRKACVVQPPAASAPHSSPTSAGHAGLFSPTSAGHAGLFSLLSGLGKALFGGISDAADQTTHVLRNLPEDSSHPVSPPEQFESLQRIGSRRHGTDLEGVRPAARSACRHQGSPRAGELTTGD